MLSALKYLKNDKSDFNRLRKTNLKKHPFMRSFSWLFQLENTPKLFFDKFNLFDYIIQKAFQIDHFMNLVFGKVFHLNIF